MFDSSLCVPKDDGQRSLGWPVSAFLCLSFVAAVLASAAPRAMAIDCPNEAQRVEQASALPDCRAYEMVTPPLKSSGEPNVPLGELQQDQEGKPLQPARLLPTGGARAAIEGNRMAWVSEPLEGSSTPGISQVSIRGTNGWSRDELVPSMSPFNDLLCPLLLGVSGWSPDLTRSILDLPAGAPRGFHEERECGHEEPRLVAGEPEHFRNLFVHNNLSGAYSLVNVTPSGVAWPEPEELNQNYWPASFLAGSDDLSHVVFEEELTLTPDAPIGYRGGNELYEWADGQVQLVTVLPDGTPVHGALAGATRNYAAESEIAGDIAFNIAQARHAVSADGFRIFFEAEGGLYLREGGDQTVQIDESQGPGPDGGGRFMVASADGSRVFFTDESKLTVDSTATSGKPDLYEYNIGSGDLTDLSVDAVEPADVLGVSGASENGSDVYFVAQGALTDKPNSEGDTATSDQPNLYLLHNGVTTFVATLDPVEDECDWTWNANCGGGGPGSGLTARTSTTGEFLGFNSVRSLTGYDNTDANTGEPDIEIFLYDSSTELLSCASCDPNGSLPTAGAAIHWPSNPGKNDASWHNAYPQRNVSDGGQVFFETADALLPRDGNGRRDVYEFEDGVLHLLSTGAGESGSHFLDATPDGSDVFFSTAQQLLPRDIDTVYDYYDARTGGGFPEPAPSSPPCGAGSCRDPGSTGGEAAGPGTSSFAGPGNVRRNRTCRVLAHRAHELNRRARALRSQAERLERDGSQGSRFRQKAERLAKRADLLSRRAKRCKHFNQRTTS